MDDILARFLADEARALNLDARNGPAADVEQIRAFAQTVLQELAARGLVRGEEEPGCWAMPRPTGH